MKILSGVNDDVVAIVCIGAVGRIVRCRYYSLQFRVYNSSDYRMLFNDLWVFHSLRTEKIRTYSNLLHRKFQPIPRHGMYDCWLLVPLNLQP